MQKQYLKHISGFCAAIGETIRRINDSAGEMAFHVAQIHSQTFDLLKQEIV